MILTSLNVSPAEFAEGTGWESKPEGMCKGDACVPAPEAVTDDGQVSVREAADRLRLPLVSDEAHGVHALGPESGGRALSSAVAPDIELPDVDGNPFRLSLLHGRKVLLVAWASW